MLPDLESLRCFETAARLLNFRTAASSVGLSPAAFGERVRRLEEQVGCSLFSRTTRRVSLTPEGEKLLPQARKTLDEAMRCVGIAHGDKAPYELTIGTRFELGLSWLTPALAHLGSVRTERTLHLFFSDSAGLLAAIRRGSIDCAVSSARLADGDIQVEVLHEEKYVFVAAPGLIKKNQIKSAKDAARHVLIDTSSDLPLFRYFRDARSRTEDWLFSRVEYLGTIGAVRYRVLEGAGVAVLPLYFIQDELKRKTLKVLLPKARTQVDHFRLLSRKGHPRERQIRELAQDLRAIPLR